MKSKKFEFYSLFFLLFLFLFSFVAPVNSLETIPLCIFKYIMHFDCPGCGLSRSFLNLSHGNFLAAIRFNALGPVIYLLLLLYLLKIFCNLLSLKISCFFEKPLFQNQFSYWSFAFLFFGQWFLKLYKTF